MAEADPSLAENDFIEFSSLSVVTPAPHTPRSNSIVTLDSWDKRSRPFNLLRTQFAKELAAGRYRLVGVTSATPAAGKSFLSANLAAALAQIVEPPVFLVDMDLRRGCVAAELGIEFDIGVADYLAGKTQRLSDVGLRIEGTQLAVFPTKVTSTNSARTLVGEQYAHLVQTVRDRSGGALAIFDLPPVFANDDAMLSLRHLDGYILVVDSGRTTRRQVQDALEMLKPARCIGTVLNRYEGGILDSYGYNSNAYDRYYSA